MSHSTYSKNGRYVNGGETEVTQSKLEWWERATFSPDVTDKIYVLEKMYELRPDKLAAVLYGDSRLFWVILQYNNILDPTLEFLEGSILKIPAKERVLSEFLTGRPGGITSTRNI